MKIEEAIEIVKKLIDEKGIKIFFEETKEALQTLLTFAEQHKEKFCECSCNKNGKSNWQIRDEIKICSSCLKPLAEQHKKPSREEIAETIKIKDLWWRTMHDEEPNPVELGKEYCLHIADALLDKFWGEK